MAQVHTGASTLLGAGALLVAGAYRGNSAA